MPLCSQRGDLDLDSCPCSRPPGLFAEQVALPRGGGISNIPAWIYNKASAELLLNFHIPHWDWFVLLLRGSKQDNSR